jgi:hypothetical protein
MPKGAEGKRRKGLDMKSPTKFATNRGKVTPPKTAMSKELKDRN